MTSNLSAYDRATLDLIVLAAKRVADFCNAAVLQQSQDSGCFVANEDVTVTVADIERAAAGEVAR